MTYASPYDDPAYYMTQAEYDAALAEWAAGPGASRTMVNPPEFLWRRPPMQSLPGDPSPVEPPEPEPEPLPTCQPFADHWAYVPRVLTDDMRAALAAGAQWADVLALSPQPEFCLPAPTGPQWAGTFGRRADARPYIGLAVRELDGTQLEERYHPATNTRLYALLERYLTEVPE